ncbi:Metal transporter Nramp4 [Dirofilaria immitis]
MQIYRLLEHINFTPRPIQLLKMNETRKVHHRFALLEGWIFRWSILEIKLFIRSFAWAVHWDVPKTTGRNVSDVIHELHALYMKIRK